MKKDYFVYILASSKNGTLYIGVTSDLVRRIYEHREGLIDGNSAILREKQLKKWHRSWKLKLIEKENPSWRDLAEEFLDSRLRGNDI